MLDLLLQKWEENIFQEDLLYSCKDYFSVFKVKPVSFWFCGNKFIENCEILVWAEFMASHYFVHFKKCLSAERVLRSGHSSITYSECCKEFFQKHFHSPREVVC